MYIIYLICHGIEKKLTSFSLWLLKAICKATESTMTKEKGRLCKKRQVRKLAIRIKEELNYNRGKHLNEVTLRENTER